VEKLCVGQLTPNPALVPPTEIERTEKRQTLSICGGFAAAADSHP
jgi:hypothetical protein